MGYTVILEQETDGGFVVTVPALPGCVSQGDTRDEAIRNIREAIELYIEDCRESGDPVPVEAGREYVDVRESTRRTKSSSTRSRGERHEVIPFIAGFKWRQSKGSIE